jgi:hypothetical protein
VNVQPTLYRVAVTSLVIALAANVLLWWVSSADDWFADIIAVASGLAALIIVLAAGVPTLVRWREEALLLAFAIWTANLIEFATEDGVRWETQWRQCGFYAAFAVVALGTYLAQRDART